MGKKPSTHNILNLFFFTILLMVAVAVIHPSPSCAQESTSLNTGMNAGCATDTWVAMANQAALETRREDLLNKRYIVKSSSVLQYSCFADEMKNMVGNIGPIFSSNKLWGEKVVVLYDGETEVIINVFKNGFSPTSLEEALILVVDESLQAYLGANFNHAPLSGTTAYQGADPLCFNMAAIWQAAKCKNFDGTQVFYRLEELIDFDPREFPPEMPCEL